MEGTLYQVSKNLITLKIEEVKYIRKSDSFYWTYEKRRDALNTSCRASFDSKEDALKYLEGLIESKIIQMRGKLNYYVQKMADFKKVNNL